jgi:uncharacterized protein
MKLNPVMWFEIYAEDLSRARQFYESVFKCKLEPMASNAELEMYSFPMEMGATGSGGALCKMKGFHPKGNSVLIYFTSDDCSLEEQRIEAAGGRVERPKMSIGEYGFISLGVDTEGNMFGIHSMK